MRIAHLSDPHLFSLEGIGPARLLNKRLTGYVNLRMRRHAVHRQSAALAVARAVRGLGVDHVVITGDMVNLALEPEFVLARQVVLDELGMPPSEVSVVPGNHDVYTAGSMRARRFWHAFEPFARSDLPGLAVEGASGPFPFVRLRGPVAIIGLSTAVPRPPLVASGVLGRAQLAALGRILAHPEVVKRTPVLLQHHPWHNPKSTTKRLLEGLYDAGAEARLFGRLPQGLLLHGHLHRRVHRLLATAAGHLDVVGATSASLVHESDERMAGFNLYEIADHGAIVRLSSHRLVGETHEIREVALPAA